MKVGIRPQSVTGNLIHTMECGYGISSSIAMNKLTTLRPDSYLHTQAPEILVTAKRSKQLHISCSEIYIHFKFRAKRGLYSSSIDLFFVVVVVANRFQPVLLV